MYVRAHIRTYIHTFIHAELHAHIHTYIHTYTHTHIHTYIQTFIHTYIHTYIHTCIHTYLHTYIDTCIHTYIHTVCLPADRPVSEAPEVVPGMLVLAGLPGAVPGGPSLSQLLRGSLAPCPRGPVFEASGLHVQFGRLVVPAPSGGYRWKPGAWIVRPVPCPSSEGMSSGVGPRVPRGGVRHGHGGLAVGRPPRHVWH